MHVMLTCIQNRRGIDCIFVTVSMTFLIHTSADVPGRAFVYIKTHKDTSIKIQRKYPFLHAYDLFKYTQTHTHNYQT